MEKFVENLLEHWQSTWVPVFNDCNKWRFISTVCIIAITPMKQTRNLEARKERKEEWKKWIKGVGLGVVNFLQLVYLWHSQWIFNYLAHTRTQTETREGARRCDSCARTRQRTCTHTSSTSRLSASVRRHEFVTKRSYFPCFVSFRPVWILTL